MKIPFAAIAFTLAPLVSHAQESGSVAAVNAPLAYIAGVLGGPDVSVIYPVPEDVDPAFWEPTADDIAAFQQADLIFLNGAGYAAWVPTTPLPRSRLVDTTAEVADSLITVSDSTPHKHGPEGEHAHAGTYAFTTWLDPQIAKAQVAAAAAAVAARWPDMETDIEARAQELDAEIDDMDAALAGFFSQLGNRQVFGSHPVYQYLDRAYSADITSLHWEPDLLPSEQELSAFSGQLDPDRDPIMLWEGAPLPETIAALSDLGVDFVVLSPMGNAAGATRLFDDIAEQVR